MDLTASLYSVANCLTHSGHAKVSHYFVLTGPATTTFACMAAAVLATCALGCDSNGRERACEVNMNCIQSHSQTCTATSTEANGCMRPASQQLHLAKFSTGPVVPAHINPSPTQNGVNSNARLLGGDTQPTVAVHIGSPSLH